ncbi:hypothetical protein V2J09_023268 [Rumex salicifolius]
MESLDDLLDFSSDIGEEDDDVENNSNSNRTKSLKSAPFSIHSSRGAKISGMVEEEELEWISNKDAFPKLESFADITIPNKNNNNKRSPVSVLENITNNNIKVPVRARSKIRRRRRREEWQGWWAIGNKSNKRSRATGGSSKPAVKREVVFGRKCEHCQTEKTPQWRAGPTGPKTLCNACGVRYKSGRLVPEYRPASSPTFSTELHSNSHRKVLEMRRLKQSERA